MSYYVLKGREQEGPHDERTLRQFLDEGKYLATDLAFRDGMSQWQPLSVVLGLQFAPPPLPSQEPAPTTTTPPPTAPLPLIAPEKIQPISGPALPQAIVISDINMPFGSMVLFILKWSLAAIPAMLLLGATLTVTWALLMAFVAGIFAHFH